MTAVAPPVTAPATAAPPRPGAVLAVVCACTVLVLAFVASVNLAAPLLAAGSLHPTSSQLLWIVDAYVVFFACLVIPGGAVGDRFGRKGVLLAGLGLFAFGALVSALSTDVAVMLVGRALTGVGAAAVLPNSLAILIHATPPARRPGAIAIWAAASGLGGALGNIGGGAILTTGSWRWLFAAVVPLALGCAAWTAVLAPRSERHHRSLDPLGAALLTLATVSLLVGIISGPENGWTSPTVLAAFGGAAALFVAWLVAELRAAQPLLDPRLFRIPLLRAGCLGMTVTFFGMFALFYVNASFLQYGRGYHVLTAGLAIVPLVVPGIVAARKVPALSARIGSITTIGLAFACIAGGLFGLSTTGRHTSYPGYASWLVLIGIGLTLALPGLTHDISAALPADQAGVGAGLQATTRELGSAIGVAVVGTLLAGRLDAGLPAGLRGDSVAEALHRAPTAGAHQQVVDAFVDATDHALLVVATVMAVAGLLVVAQSLWSARR